MMTNYEYSLIASAAFILALTAYPEHAEIKGWRTGAVFAKPATKITFMSGLLSIAVVIHVIVDMVRGGLSWWWTLILPASYFLGGLLVTSVFGRLTGIVSLIGAPASFAIASYFYATQ